jgi:hypothetical protein
MIPTNFSFSVPALRPLRLLARYSSPLTTPGGVVRAGIFTLCVSLVMASTPLRAMEWTAQMSLSSMDAGNFVYAGEGEIDLDDAQKLEKLYASKKSLEGKLGVRSVVRLNSPGGEIEGGMQLGEVIRKLGLATEVPASAGCYSACTFAFLGGVDRQVEGKFGIHALSLDKGTPSSSTLDKIQRWASFMVLYARELVGKSEMAEMALTLGGSASDIRLVPDNLLRDWNIITIAARPSQLYAANELHTLSCGTSSSHPNVMKAVCNGLDLARLDRRITVALAALKSRPLFDRIELEQQRWLRSRDQCEAAYPLIDDNGKIAVDRRPGTLGYFLPLADDNVGRRTGTLGVTDCLSGVYNIRAKELEALVAYFEAGETAIAKKGWKTPAQ